MLYSSKQNVKRWGLILDCEKEEITLDTGAAHDHSQLEDEKFPSNLINLAETTSPSQETMCQTDSQEYLEQVNSVYPEHESPEEERNSEEQTHTQSETIPFQPTSKILENVHEATETKVALESTIKILKDVHEATEPEVALEPTNRILEDEYEAPETEVI